MRSNYLKTLKTAVLAISVLLLGVSVTVAQQQINLTAGPTAITLSDGTSVPMWGYTCGAVVSGSTATCAKSNPAATGWSPVVITVPTGQGLQINLTNNLSFANGNSVPTSLTIVGQLGGGLGTPGGTTDAPDHSQAQTVTWPASDPSTLGAPPAQGNTCSIVWHGSSGGYDHVICRGRPCGPAPTCLSRARILRFRVRWVCTES